MPMPLYDALLSFAAEKPLRMHMPGHKGKGLPLHGLDAAALLDFTELPPTGDLFAGGGAIEAAERLWAAAAGMEQCLFLTGGSTEGLHAALALVCRPGDGILMDRSCHRAVYNAAALLDLRPVYLSRAWRQDVGLPGVISPETVAQAMDDHPEIKTVCITSPTYYGLLSDIPAISEEVHRRGGKLVVDAAHGAHLFWMDEGRFLAGADLLVASAHKTLRALGQTAVLLANGYSHAALRSAGALYGSSSPSYVLMASLDAAREDMEQGGAGRCRAVAKRVAELRRKFPAVTEAGGPADPLRLTLLTEDGFGAQKALQRQEVWPEMADSNHVVFILTAADGQEELNRLEAALKKLNSWWGFTGAGALTLPPKPEVEYTLREALFAPKERLPLELAKGRVCACQVAPYPPGVPVIAPGEIITKKALAYLAKVGYNMVQEIAVVADA